MFWHRLALALGRHDIEELREDVSAESVVRWKTYFDAIDSRRK